MRQWHRWMGICFAVFLLVISGTGVTIQVLDLIAAKNKPDATVAPRTAGTTGNDAVARPAADDGDSHPDEGSKRHKHEEAADGGQMQATTALADAPKPKQPQSSLRRWNHWIKDLHSGVLLGPVGIFVSMLSGVALIFFAISGMWMYWQMFSRRKAAGRNSFFWKR